MKTTHLYKPMTRTQLAEELGIHPRTLQRFCEKENIAIRKNVLLTPHTIETIKSFYYPMS
jgi:hypothetical protein